MHCPKLLHIIAADHSYQEYVDYSPKFKKVLRLLYCGSPCHDLVKNRLSKKANRHITFKMVTLGNLHW